MSVKAKQVNIEESLGWVDDAVDVESVGSPKIVINETLDWLSESKVEPEKGKREKEDITPFYERPIISIDTEYKASENGEFNEILSYQLVVRCNKKSSGLILYPSSTKKSGRLSMDKCIVASIEHAIESKVLDTYPLDIILCAHFLKADLFNFSNAFEKLKTHVKSVRKTVASLDSVYGLDLSKVMNRRIDKEPLKVWSNSGNDYLLHISFYDTMLLSPAGKSLADVGELVGLPKLDIPKPYSIERMDEYLAGDKVGFEAYALRDAEVSALHMEKIMEFCQTIKLSSVPFTIGGIAIKSFINSLGDSKGYRQMFGFDQVSKEIWSEHKNQPLTIKRDVPSQARMTLESFATQCYHGGRNESFMMGPTGIATWNDFDAPSFYTAIQIGLRELDYLNMRMSNQVEDFFGDICSVAWVKFEFPAETRFPSLPVRADSFGLIYPLKGESFCTGHELEVAFNQGAELVIKQGFIVPWLNEVRIFEPFMRWVRDSRKKHEKGDFEERLYKEIGNSSYGKLAQGLRPKTAFDLEVGYSKQMPPSTITNPLFAAYVTGLGRAVMSEKLNGIPMHRQVVSVTTDGFLTDSKLSEIDLSGPICQRFREHFHRIDSEKGEILERKHQVRQLIAMKTRGQLTVIESDNAKPVLAKAGIKPPRDITNQNGYMVDLYLNRVAGQLTDGSHLTSTREMFLGQRDLMNVNKDIRLNIEFDWKRKLVNPRTIQVGKLSHIAFNTIPHETIDDMLFVRLRFDRWRRENCLKSLTDWQEWEDRFSMAKTVSSKSLRLQKGETSTTLMKRLFLRFFSQKQAGLGMSNMNSNQLANWLTSHGFETKATAVRSAKQAKLIYEAVPVTELTVQLLQRLLEQFPYFEFEVLFQPQQLPRLHNMLCSKNNS
jgi:hypothetical protein